MTPSTGCIEADLISQLDDVETRNIQVCSKKEDPTIGNFIERMWAHLTIQKVLYIEVFVTSLAI